MRLLLRIFVAALVLLCSALPARAQCPSTPGPPGISPSGGVFDRPVTVTLSKQQSDYDILYTVNGTDPPPGTTYSSPLVFDRTTTLKAVQGCYDVWAGYRWSAVVTETYVMKAATPVFSLPAGSYPPGTTIQVTSTTPGASIRYRLDGQTPSDTDPEVPAGGMLMVGSFSLTARAFYHFMDPSDVVTATYAATGSYTAGIVEAGRTHAVALTRDGALWTWGANGQRQLGYGERWMLDPFNFTPRGELVVGTVTSPQRKSVTGVRAVAAGNDTSVALRHDGTVWTWGWNAYGQLGRTTCEVDYPTNNTCVRPGRVTELTGIAAVAAGAEHALALSGTGTVSAWGQNWAGQLGDGTTTRRSTPQPVSGLTQVVAVAAGAHHTLALRADGTVWAWGYNSDGQIGDGASGEANSRLVPVQVSGLTNARGIGGGEYHSLAIDAAGTLWTWGWNGHGQLGDGTLSPRPTPTAVLTDVIAAAAGRFHTVAIKIDGTMWAWGSNSDGQLGDGTFTTRVVPTRVLGVPPMRAVAASDHTLAIAQDGSGWVWGRNTDGQVGDGTTTNRPTPLQLFPADTFDSCAQAQVSPTTLSVPNTGGTFALDVAIGSGCVWTTSSDSAWAQPSAGSTGPGVVTVVVDVNYDDARTATLTIAGQTVSVTQAGGPPTSNEETSYFHTDAIGSVRVITSATGAVVARYDYLPFGVEWTTSTFANNVRFAGKERDAETKFGGWEALDYFGARYYQAQIGRFTTTDPFMDVEKAIVEPQRWNRYSYALNNPFRFTDPDGRAVETIWDALNIGLGLTSLVDNLRQGNYRAAVVDASGVVLDSAAAVVPFVPGGFGAGLRLSRELDRASDIATAIRTRTDRIIQHLSREDLVGAAREVVTRVPHGGQHLKEVQEAAKALKARIKDINQGLSNPRLSRDRRRELERELGLASRHLDAAEDALSGQYFQHGVP